MTLADFQESYVRVAADAGDALASVTGRTIRGYAVKWGEPSGDLGGFRERFRKGAFAESLRDPAADPLAFWNHDPSMVLGRRSARTFRVWEDDIGLAYEIDVPDTMLGRDALLSVRRGDVRGASVRFARGAKDEWSMGADGVRIRDIVAARLMEVSLTAVPAYESSTAEARASMTPKLDAAMRRIDAEAGAKTPLRNLAERRLRLLQS